MMNVKRLRPAYLLLALALLACGGRLRAEEDYKKIIYWRVGEPAPAIELKDDQGNLWKSSQYQGKKYVVVYFYLGDFMNNCTKQACAYRDDYGKAGFPLLPVIGARLSW